MAAASAYMAKVLLDYSFGGAAAVQPGSRFCALFSGIPTSVYFYGSELNTIMGYTRLTTLWGAAASPAGSASNTAALTFGPFSSQEPIVAAGIMDAGIFSAGNNVVFGTLATARTVNPGDTLIFAAGALLATMT